MFALLPFFFIIFIEFVFYATDTYLKTRLFIERQVFLFSLLSPRIENGLPFYVLQM